MATDLIRSDINFTGNVSFGGTVYLPNASVGNANIPAGAGIDASKVNGRHMIRHAQKNGTAVVTETMMVHVAYLAGTILQFAVRPRAKPTGGDLAFTVDLQSAPNGSNTWTSHLSAAVSVSSADTDDTIKLGTLSDTTYAAGDTLRIVITTSGSTGTQGQGVICELVIDENGA